MNSLPTLSVLVPCYNEERTIVQVLEKLLSLECVTEVIVVDDGSTDLTKHLLSEFASTRIKIFTEEKNRGKGYALRKGIFEANCDYLVIQDADLEYSPEDILGLLEVASNENADAVFGSRFLTSGSRRAVYYWHRLGNLFLTNLSNAVTNVYITDMETCYKLIRTSIAKVMDLRENRFGIEPEFTAKLAAVKASIFEVPIRYTARTYEEGKKINWKDGISAIRAILKYSSPWERNAMRKRLFDSQN